MNILKRCRIDITRIERCFVCPSKCGDFLNWYNDNKEWYESMVNDYVSRFPEKYQKEYVIMEKQKKQSQPKMVAIVSNDQIEEIIPKNDLTRSSDAERFSGRRIIELTGKEYEVIVSIALKQKTLKESMAGTTKRGVKK
ncbi:MAG: hypothetical protein PHX79_05555 [Sphaerochaetaceae bacterium]|nr:hypothetical protein [Sphaerochaetaceae bacterium]